MNELRGSLEEAIGLGLQRALVTTRWPLTGKALSRTCREVASKTAAHQRMLGANSGRVGRVEVVRELIRQSEELRFRKPKRMLRLARAAVSVAEGMRPDAAPAGLVEDARAEAWGSVANALRILGDLREADAAWQRAHSHAALGSGDPLLQAKAAWLEALLRRRQQRLAEAIDLLRVAGGLYERLKEPHLRGKVLITLAITLHEAGEFGPAASEAVRGGLLVDPSREPSLVLAAMNNLVFYLHQAGRHEEASHYLPFVRELIEAQGQPLELLRLRWLEAKVALVDGRKVEARAHFEAVRKGFVEQSMPYDAALVSLELALLYAESGWTADVERWASEMYPVFVSNDLPRETTASLLLFVRAVNNGDASPELIRDLLARLERRPPPGD